MFTDFRNQDVDFLGSLYWLSQQLWRRAEEGAIRVGRTSLDRGRFELGLKDGELFMMWRGVQAAWTASVKARWLWWAWHEGWAGRRWVYLKKRGVNWKVMGTRLRWRLTFSTRTWRIVPLLPQVNFSIICGWCMLEIRNGLTRLLRFYSRAFSPWLIFITLFFLMHLLFLFP